jgi:uncharacterized protein (TIGR02145 family)
MLNVNTYIGNFGRKLLLCLFAAILLIPEGQAQPPQLVKYQAVARDAAGELIQNTAVTLTINIRQTAPGGSIVCAEVFNTTSNDFGILTVDIGSQNPVDFLAIDWSAGPYFMEVILNGVIMGTSQFLSVPYALHAIKAENFDEVDPSFPGTPAEGITATNISNWNTAFGWGDHAGLYKPIGYVPSWADVTGKPTTLAGYGITDAMNTSHPANSIAGGDITNWNTAFGWGNHAGLYRPIAWVPSFSDITGTPTTIAGYGITDGMSTSHPANAITAGNITNWNTAFGWGNHTGLYRPISYVPSWGDITGKPVFADVATSGLYSDLTDKPEGNNPGDMFYWNGMEWEVLPVGVPGQFLQLRPGLIPTFFGDGWAEITTTAVTEITTTTAKSGGNVLDEGGGDVVERGVCWSETPNPTVNDDKTSDGFGIGAFESNLIGLTEGTTYYLRAYAVNGAGPVYGNEISFTTAGTAIDIDGNTYITRKIGNQWWFGENLRVSKYNNNDPIPNVQVLNPDWAGLATGAWVNYNNNAGNDPLYGKLYNWYAVSDARGICPTGWHVPTFAEWTELLDHAGGETIAGGPLKSVLTEPDPHPRWDSPNTGATDEYYFRAVPNGYRSDFSDFLALGGYAFFWTATEWDANNARYHYFRFNDVFTDRQNGLKKYGMAVRCVKD